MDGEDKKIIEKVFIKMFYVGEREREKHLIVVQCTADMLICFLSRETFVDQH